MRLKRHLLTEKTFRVNEDVKFIYDKAFKKFIKDFEKGTIPAELQRWIVEKKAFFIKTFDSAELKTMAAKAAHLVNPITINAGVLQGSYYDPIEKIMHVGLDINAAHLLFTKGGVPDWQRKYIDNEIKEAKIKATIAHELSHWISDSTHNFELSKLVNLAAELKSGEVLKLHKKNINMTYFEVDAIIHGIKAVKSKLGNKKWDTLTFEQVGELYPSLWSVIKNLEQYGKDVVEIYKKSVLKRMARENMIGKNMRKGI